ncbi:MAG TPA: acyltransferase, partial [Polyangiaceae bacterium]
MLLFHMNMHVHAYRFHSAPAKQAAARALLAITDRGWVGVDLFFVLSGFLITRILVDARTSTNYYRVFYARRALRIFPLYFSVLVLGLVVVPSLAHITSAGYTSAVQHQWYLWTYCSNIGSSFGVEFGPFSHFWSLAVEEHFYLLWPFLVRISPPKRLAPICIVCIFGALVARLALIHAGLPVAAGWLTPSRVDAFGFGGLAAVVADGVTNTKWRRLFGRAIFAI